MLDRKEVEDLVSEHAKAPHLRLLQKRLAKELTIFIHSEEDYEIATEASEILFGKGTTETLAKLPENVFLSVFDGVPMVDVEANKLKAGIPVLEFLADVTNAFASRGEARRMVKDNGVSINKEKISDDVTIDSSYLINNKYILVQKGKKNFYLVKTI